MLDNEITSYIGLSSRVHYKKTTSRLSSSVEFNYVSISLAQSMLYFVLQVASLDDSVSLVRLLWGAACRPP
uniref:Acyl-desaturase n=1 Tax=Arundo donax TaxID=35708 RepID=A0A0A9ACY9_ARUDO